MAQHGPWVVLPSSSSYPLWKASGEGATNRLDIDTVRVGVNRVAKMLDLPVRPRGGYIPRSVEKERRPPLRHQNIISGGNLRVFENLAQTLVAVDAS